ncbi:hypothetical protein LCGC14_2073600 [marine sediment metagenome]|uniref:Uncharacterized protein n=1 Tax=marine sediment metagenome TaxID=412755 RepID=A0A0F9F503_9ZZZZ
MKRKCNIFTEKDCQKDSIRGRFLIPNLFNPNLFISWCVDHASEAKEVLTKLGIKD